MLRYYFIIAFAAQGGLTVAFFLVQTIVQDSMAFFVFLLLYGLMVGLQLGQGKLHLSLKKAEGKDLDEDMDNPMTERGSVSNPVTKQVELDNKLKLQKRGKWHAKMIAYPVISMLSSSLLFIIGDGQLLMYRMNESRQCDKGMLQAFWSLEALEFMIFVLCLGAYGAVMLTQIMLSVTHYRALTKLTRRTEDEVRPEEEVQWTVLYGARLFTRYRVTVLCEFALYVTLLAARQPAGMPEGVFAMLWAAYYVWGLQLNMADDFHFHTSFPSDLEIIKPKARMRWHGRKMFLSLGLVLGNQFLFCAAWMFLLPYYFQYTTDTEGRIVCPDSIGEAFARQMNSQGWWYFLLSLVFLVPAMLSLLDLAKQHFEAYKKFGKKISMELGIAIQRRRRLARNAAKAKKKREKHGINTLTPEESEYDDFLEEISDEMSSDSDSSDDGYEAAAMDTGDADYM